MDSSLLKLGDKIVVDSGPSAGREGHVVGITSNGQIDTAMVTVRLDGGLESEFVKLSAKEIRKAS